MTPPPPVHRRPVEVVDPRWLLKAAAVVVLVAVFCAWLTLCLLFWQGQWQLVLHPSSLVQQTPATLGLTFEEVHFGADAVGHPQLTGWWIPSDSTNDPTVLLLHSGDGNVANALPLAHILHAARLNVLLFDYRGYGLSPGPHPTQASMQVDAEAALAYLTATRNIPLQHLLFVGESTGASLATHLAAQHSDAAALLLIAPDGDLTARVRQDPRARMVPLALFSRDTFPLTAPLETIHTPKLIVSYADQKNPHNFHQAADPKMTVELGSTTTGEPLRSIQRFLDDYPPNKR